MHFTKMQGAGNDFIVLDAVPAPLGITLEAAPALVRRLCDRHMGIGADGVMLLQRPAGDADIAMRFYNSDGSIGEMCGNGARCVCRYACEHGYAGDVIRVETTAGLVTGWRQGRDRFRIRLNTPTILEPEKALDVDGDTIICGYVVLGDPGIPHLAVEIPDLLQRVDDGQKLTALRALGRKLRYHPALPKGANVNFYQLTGAAHVYEKTYERGVEDFTLACGTGTGSVAAVLAASGRVSGMHVSFDMAGGQLEVDVGMADGHVRDLFLTGPARMVCDGELAEEFLYSDRTEAL